MVDAYFSIELGLKTVLDGKAEVFRAASLHEIEPLFVAHQSEWALIIIGGGIAYVGLQTVQASVASIRESYKGPLLFATGNPDNDRTLVKQAGTNASGALHPRDFYAKVVELLGIK